jgi:predicted double-glycine peptidase
MQLNMVKNRLASYLPKALVLLLPVLLVLAGCSGRTGVQEQPPLSRTAEVLLRVPLCRQATGYTCGVASLQSILYYYGYEIRQDNLAEELESNPETGTNYHKIMNAAQVRDIRVEARRDLTLDELKAALHGGKPVMVAIQAWADNPSLYADDWDDGHWAIAIGYDKERIYLMDPSTLGNFTCIPVSEFLLRWHDLDSDNATRLIHFGLIFDKDGRPAYDPEAILPLLYFPGLNNTVEIRYFDPISSFCA